MRSFSVATDRHRDLIDVTAQVSRAVADAGVGDGLCVVFSPHTTCSVTINENADPDVVTDLLEAYVALLGDERRFQHAEGNSGGHALVSLTGPSVTIPISGGRLALGTWQAVYLCEWDGPRQRTLHVQVLPGHA